jgi:hypothetical protein
MDLAKRWAYARWIETPQDRHGLARRSTAAKGATVQDRGASLIGLLVVLVVLGVTAAIVVSALPSSKSLTVPTVATTSTTRGPGSISPGRGTTTTTSQTILSAALEAACVANVQAVQSAATTYETINGTKPPAGTGWATAPTHGGPFLQSWPTATSEVAVRWSGTTVVVTPTRGRTAVGSPGSRTPPTGCYAI